ncbi:hypothetical protein LSM04_003615 [Trypanosoma melophagium]|uniref:uncharacterized protein n=1 Tax=Trypanosoma melophagium TaxID=715481 RepID=UPI00351A2CD3|nr:hypothetical protein LSM04_003615 [Trypanosoma melophagium]
MVSAANGQREKSTELLLPLDDMVSPAQKEEQENQKACHNDVYRSSCSQLEDPVRWTKLIEVMNQSPSRPSERAFRASFINM